MFISLKCVIMPSVSNAKSPAKFFPDKMIWVKPKNEYTKILKGFWLIENI